MDLASHHLAKGCCDPHLSRVMNPRFGCLIATLVVGLGARCVRADSATDAAPAPPERVQPSTGDVSDLRAIPDNVDDALDDWLDAGHDWLYRGVQYFIEDIDTWFAQDGTAPLVVPVTPLRLDFDSEVLHKRGYVGWDSAASVDAVIRLPNLEHRLRIFITNDSIGETPVTGPAEAQNPLLAGLRYTPVAHVDAEFGVHAKILPSAFAALRWASGVNLGSLHIYPFVKAYVETGLGLGVASGLGVDHWDGRWIVRSTSYANWVRDNAATSWAETFIFGHASAVLREHQYDRLADGHDVACGVVGKLAASGDRTSRVTLYEANVLYKRPLHDGWLYGYAGPMVRWDRNFHWHPDAGVRLGFDALLWGLATPADKLPDYCH